MTFNHPEFCPYCGMRTLIDAGAVFVEWGTCDGGKYEFECDVDQYHCVSCKHQFSDYDKGMLCPECSSPKIGINDNEDKYQCQKCNHEFDQELTK